MEWSSYDLDEDYSNNVNKKDKEKWSQIMAELELILYIEKKWLNVSIDDIRDIIYNSFDNQIEFFKYIFKLHEEKNFELEQINLDVFVNAWNNFPHKRLWWMSPTEKSKEIYW
jgi:hypothetical protein